MLHIFATLVLLMLMLY